MKNTSIIIIIVVVALLAVGGYFFVSNNKEDTAKTPSDVQITEQVDLSTPSRPAEINGTVLSVEGNIIVISNEVGKEQLTEEERDVRKKELANLTPEEKQALRKEELDNLETEDIEIIIPVGVTITKGSGDSSGDSVIAEISELEKGIYLSIWQTESNTPEFVKIKGLGQ